MVESSGTGGGDDEGGEGGSAPVGAEEGGGDAVASTSAGSSAAGTCDPFAQEVVAVSYGPDAAFGQEEMPGVVLGPPQGGGETQGSLHVVALGNGGSITLAFGGVTIVDGEGPDFVVFENAFFAGGDPEQPFAELATVEVSEDGETWHAFPCTASAYPYGPCAGWHPVLANASENEISPLDPATAGGDAFDLADVGLAAARFVRITDREDTTGLAGSFDLDAVSVVHATCDLEG